MGKVGKEKLTPDWKKRVQVKKINFNFNFKIDQLFYGGNPTKKNRHFNDMLFTFQVWRSS